MTSSPPGPRLALVTLTVRDYDEAIDFYTRRVGFTLRHDTDMGAGKRWVVVAPPDNSAGLLLAKAATPEQIASVGNQTGGRVFLFITTDDFHRDHARMTAQGVIFEGPARHETYGTVAVFRDLYGNRIDLIQPR
ncbi:MAG: VOC family protein [Phycisphaeraceae bacterium]|nr:VOC family protein [Phycisphaeraceae bacterium]